MKQRGNVRYLWVLVGGYLVYLGWGQFQFVYRGETEIPAVSILAGAAFIAVGGWVLWREWQAYRWAEAHKDAPESWREEPAENTDALPDREPEETDNPSGPVEPVDAEEPDEEPADADRESESDKEGGAP